MTTTTAIGSIRTQRENCAKYQTLKGGESEMKCIYCGKKVTQSQLNHAEAIKVARGKYAHTDCIDDRTRHPRDAYHRP